MLSGKHTIRFVGGPWHNRLEHVALVPVVKVAYRPNGQAEFKAWTFYYLASYYTGLNTLYYQYVHSSLIHHGRTERQTYTETLPVLSLNTRTLERRLAKAMAA